MRQTFSQLFSVSLSRKREGGESLAECGEYVRVVLPRVAEGRSLLNKVVSVQRGIHSVVVSFSGDLMGAGKFARR